MKLRTQRAAALALVFYVVCFVLLPRPFRFEEARSSRGTRAPPKSLVCLPLSLAAQQSFGLPELRQIPLVIHQAAESALVDHAVADASRAWREAALHGFFDYKFWDLEAQRALVAARAGGALRAAFGAGGPRSRMRLFRALLLFEEGGVFASLGSRLVAPRALFSLLVRRPDDAAVLGCGLVGEPWEGVSRCRVDDGVLAFAPRHPVLAVYLDAAAKPTAPGLGARALADAVVRAGFRPRCDGELAFSADRSWNVRSLPGLRLDGAAMPADDDDDGADDALRPRRPPPRWWPPISPKEERTTWRARNVSCLWRWY